MYVRSFRALSRVHMSHSSCQAAWKQTDIPVPGPSPAAWGSPGTSDEMGWSLTLQSTASACPARVQGVGDDSQCALRTPAVGWSPCLSWMDRILWVRGGPGLPFLPRYCNVAPSTTPQPVGRSSLYVTTPRTDILMALCSQ